MWGRITRIILRGTETAISSAPDEPGFRVLTSTALLNHRTERWVGLKDKFAHRRALYQAEKTLIFCKNSGMLVQPATPFYVQVANTTCQQFIQLSPRTTTRLDVSEPWPNLCRGMHIAGADTGR